MLTLEDLLIQTDVQVGFEVRKWSDTIDDYSIRKRFSSVGEIPRKLLNQNIQCIYTVDNTLILELETYRAWDELEYPIHIYCR